MRWGFSRFDGKGEIINARLETVSEKPMFRKPFLLYRCPDSCQLFFRMGKEGANKTEVCFRFEGAYLPSRALPG